MTIKSLTKRERVIFYVLGTLAIVVLIIPWVFYFIGVE